MLLVLVSVSLLSGALYWTSQSLAPDRGRFVVPGIDAEVEIYRDRLGVPNIFASSTEDAAAALGFIHASDRLWQMEAMRRFGNGRLAEIVGEAGLASDRLVRTLGIPRLAEQQVAQLAPETRRVLDAYAEGVNAWIQRHRNALPLEFIVLGFEPEPWRPADSVVWARTMAMHLSGNWRDELLRARMAEVLTDEQLLAFWYPDGDSTQQPMRFSGNLYKDAIAGLPLVDIAALSPNAPDQPVGASNAWTVRGDLSETGSPLLANDPHLGYSLPVLWYLARIETPRGVLAGATVPGVPFTVLGHNAEIAWGMTTTESDQQDVFIERLSDDGRFYQDETGKWIEVETRTERIGVAGGEDVDLRVRRTRNGPIISDLVDPLPGLVGPGYALALSAAYLAPDDRTPDALYRLNRANDWESFVAALEDFHTPQQNIVFADRAGNIGFLAPGRVPVRASGRGRMPVPGWTGAGAWRGWVPFDELPVAYNPAPGRIVSANNRIVSTDYPHFITDDWAPPYRARRIFELLDASPLHSSESFLSMQTDIVSTMARDLLPRMTAISPRDRRAAEAVARLSRWDGVMTPDAPEPLIFIAWLRRLQGAIINDEMGDLAREASRLRPRFIDRVLNLDSQWCDDVRTDDREDCDRILEAALIRGLDDIDDLPGEGQAAPLWGEAHAARFVNRVVAALPLIGQELGIREVRVGGGNDTLNRGGMRIGDPDYPFAAIHGPGYRAVYDLGDLDRSRFSIATGQSGNPFSLHYDDFVPLWREGRTVELSGSRSAFRASSVEAMQLLPATPSAPLPDPVSGVLDDAAMAFVDILKSLLR